ncbi:spermidine/putrescine ABC transporter substrate-binding protein [Homoserinimonas sp. OAct 916]|uniref:polyamine ABC transporter substrate-binding protein n=1 Tax=Homoserinimonas sp. OAct 916 TaxID=2211450 RepID=UPI000DBE0218|nr:spermidine/putrescine ABC transporter substrate-binding protein [Homoserinimonas sp. OAct 916]
MLFRRSKLRVAAATAIAAVAALGLGACSAGDSGGAALDPDADLTKQSLVVGIWSDYYPEDLAERFEAKTGIPMTIVNHATNEEIVAKIMASGDSGIDVAFMSGQYAQALGEQGVLQELDKSFIPNEANLYPEAKELAYDPGNKVSLPYAWGTTGLCYRSDLIDFTPDSWNDLLNPKPELEGKTTMLATERWMTLPAQKLLGFSANSTSADELAQVRAQLEKTKPTLLAFDDTTFYQKLITGEAVLTEAWDGWCNYGVAEDPNIKFVIPKEGSDLWTDTMTVLKSSKNKEAAMTFLNFILEPDVHSWVVENILYNVPNRAANELVDPQMAVDFPSLAITPAELSEQEGLIDVGDFSTEYSRLVTEIQAG